MSKTSYNKGEQNGGAKLSEDQVRQIRELSGLPGWNCISLGKRFGVHYSTAWRIQRGMRWRHLEKGE